MDERFIAIALAQVEEMQNNNPCREYQQGWCDAVEQIARMLNIELSPKG